jgi:hypothetical protein
MLDLSMVREGGSSSGWVNSGLGNSLSGSSSLGLSGLVNLQEVLKVCPSTCAKSQYCSNSWSSECWVGVTASGSPINDVGTGAIDEEGGSPKVGCEESVTGFSLC